MVVVFEDITDVIQLYIKFYSPSLRSNSAGLLQYHLICILL